MLGLANGRENEEAFINAGFPGGRGDAPRKNGVNASVCGERFQNDPGIGRLLQYVDKQLVAVMAVFDAVRAGNKDNGIFGNTYFLPGKLCFG